ncbi:MAG: hypothetical protein QW622_00900 [Candidatus Pacearchaeota archaeon]
MEYKICKVCKREYELHDENKKFYSVFERFDKNYVKIDNNKLIISRERFDKEEIDLIWFTCACGNTLLWDILISE